MIQELDAQKMKVMKEIADTNLLVAGMKAELLKLEEDKEKFFVLRDNEVLGRIHKLLNNSRVLLDETRDNYIFTHDFYETIKIYSEDVKEGYQVLQGIIAEFSEKAVTWQEEIKNQETEIVEMKKDLQRDKESMDREKEFLQKKKKAVDDDRKRLESQQEALATSYKELKNLWNKLKKN